MMNSTSQRKALLIIGLWAAAATAFHLYTAFIGYLEPRTQRSIHLAFMLPLVFLLFPTFRNRQGSDKGLDKDLTWIDWGLALLALLPMVYSYFAANRINFRLEDVDPVLPVELVMGSVATVLVLEAVRRAVSPMMAGLIVAGVAYLFLTEWMPGFWQYRNIPFSEVIEAMYLTNGQGIFGAITGISATMVAIFIAFGAFVSASGTGRLFNNLGLRVAGKYAGGPAKVSVIISALFGTMSGSSSSNVFTTGSFTIPLMKKLGYRPSFAGGVETAASVGGQSAPPIMGAGAFVMAEITNTPYTDIIIAAVLGSLCYFTMIFVSVHLEAKKAGILGLDEDSISSWKELARDLHLFIPIIVLLTLLLMRFSPHFAAFYSILTTVVVTSIRSHTRLTLSKVYETFVTAGKNTAPIAVACVGAGMFVAALTKTGVVVSLGTLVAGFAGGELWLAGVLLMFLTLLLGMGVPTTPAYVITAAIGAPALISDFGVPVLGAHMFVFYFATLADATPPVSVASYAAASIAKADPLKTGAQAARIAIAGYIVGYSYLFVPELRMEGALFDIVVNWFVIVGGLTIFASGVTGYLSTRLPGVLRLVMIVSGLTLALFHQFSAESRVVVIVALLVALYLIPQRLGWEQSKPLKVS